MFVVAHVSDTHFGNDQQDPTTRLDRVMDHLLALDPRPDVLVVSGDVADHGLPEEYAAARAWLESELAASHQPTFVVLHHPPLTIGIGLMDPIRLLDGEPLGAVVTRHPHVLATLVGHAHTMATTTFGGRPLLIGGGVVSTVPLDIEPLRIVWYDGPPTLAIHLVDDDPGSPPRVTTHWRALPAQ
jgi:3',5'-cyclic AMP phosphodiesterase CpdA